MPFGEWFTYGYRHKECQVKEFEEHAKKMRELEKKEKDQDQEQKDAGLQHSYDTDYFQNYTVFGKIIYVLGYLGWTSVIFWIIRAAQAGFYQNRERRLTLYTKTYSFFGYFYLSILILGFIWGIIYANPYYDSFTLAGQLCWERCADVYYDDEKPYPEYIEVQFNQGDDNTFHCLCKSKHPNPKIDMLITHHEETLTLPPSES